MRKSNWTPSIVPNGGCGDTIAVAGMYTFAEAVCTRLTRTTLAKEVL
jgi:hypothetical protein